MSFLDDHQTEIFAFLSDPATYGLGVPVKRIDTHGAAVFLAGPDVYKVKRAVRFSYMDFSTLEKRRAACEAELAINRCYAPELYLDIVPITRDADGYHLDGSGEAVEWAVHLRRFDEEATFDRIAGRGPLGSALVDKLARAVLASHRRVESRDAPRATASLHHILLDTLEELAFEPRNLPVCDVEPVRTALLSAFDKALPLLRQRAAAGFVRRCHGDLHLGNIALIGGEPVLFDAIEFDEALATTDIFYDLAYLLMDLCERGLTGDANHLLNRYLEDCSPAEEAIEGIALLPLFLGLRAAIRAKVLAAQARLGHGEEFWAEARAYIAAARGFLEAAPSRLIVIGGLSGTGKSCLAAALAPLVGAPPGAIHLRSDIERKKLFGRMETERLPATAYSDADTRRTYERLSTLARSVLEAGSCVIVDATFRRFEERTAIEKLAAAAGVAFTGIWLEAPLPVRMSRVADRRGDASDATPDIARTQDEKDVGAVRWHRLDASRPLDLVVNSTLAKIAG
ncbi:MAG TPA: AAA family ATPase [Aliidongia sp.]|nr:AAA family ATPase [Aliidongia sp.]